MKKLFFIINPVSGKIALEDSIMRVLEVFSAADYDINIYFTKSEEDMKEQVIKRGNDFDLIVCCGGDGTLNLVAGAMYLNNIKTTLGYIPGGTTNDFANSRDISTFAIDAARQIVEGEEKGLDVGVFNGKPFVYVAAFGMFSELSYNTTRQMKQAMGYGAYLMGGFKSFATTKPCRMKLEYDGKVIEDDYIYGMVCNSKRVGGLALNMFKNTDFYDGEMEVLLVRKPKKAFDTQKILNALVATKGDGDVVQTFKTDRLKITSEEEIPWALDGEFGGAYKEVEVIVDKAAVKMLF